MKKEATMKNDFFDAVKGISAPKETKDKKDKIQTLIPTEELQTTVDELVDWKKKLKEAKSETEGREADVIEYVKSFQDERGFEGDYQKSFRVKGVNEIVTVVSSDRFSAFNPEDEPLLQEVLGKKFVEFVEERIQVTVKEEIFENPELQKELLSLIPKDQFGKFFNAERKLVCKKEFDRRIYSLGQKTVERLRPLVKQAKPSVR
mgnify:CR=1 FL=1